MTTIQEIRSQTERKMTRSLEGLREEFRKIRTGRASTVCLTPFMLSTTAPARRSRSAPP